MARATLKDVAEKAGVSTATVSYVINGSKKTISEETKNKVLKAIEELNYVTDLNAKSLVVKDSKLIGVVIPQTEEKDHRLFSNNFYSEILGSIEYEARKAGYQIIVSGMDIDEEFIKAARQRNLDGVIAIGVYTEEISDSFKNLDIPMILVDSYCKNANYPNVRIDDYAGGYMATEYMISKGHKKIVFLSGELKENGVMQKRFTGYKAALGDYGIAYNEAYVYEGKVDFESGLQLAKKIVADKTDVTAVVCTADIMAIGAIKGFSEAGKSVPDDISITGFDDISLCAYTTPGLTTVKQEIQAKGVSAMQLLSEAMKGQDIEQDIVLPVHMIERESVRKI